MKLADIAPTANRDVMTRSYIEHIRESFLLRLPPRYHDLVGPIQAEGALSVNGRDKAELYSFGIKGQINSTAVVLLIDTVKHLAGHEPVYDRDWRYAWWGIKLGEAPYPFTCSITQYGPETQSCYLTLFCH